MHMIPYLLTALVLTPASVQATAYKLTDDNAFWLGGAIGRGHFAETSLDSNQQHFYDSFSSKWEVGYDVYHNFGGFLSYDFANASPDIHLGTIGIRGIGHITESLDWYAKTGMSRVLIGNSANNNDNGLSGMLGLGVEYQLAHALSMKVGVDYYHRLEATPFTSGHLSQFYWGLSYRFGQTAPVAKTPVAKTPVAKTPVAKTPVAKTPVAKTPVAKTLNADSLFVTNSSYLSATHNLEGILFMMLNDTQSRLTVVGHTDNVGTHEYNLWLSLRRAHAVAKYFIANGIKSKRIQVDARGAEEPIASNASESGRTLNRRVVVTIQ